MSSSDVYSPGLEGIVAGETAISTVTGGLRYRGYPVTELAEKATFEEVAFLLLHGDLPNKKSLAEFRERIGASTSLPASLHGLLEQLPKTAAPMYVVRTAVSVLAMYDPEVADNSHAANIRKAERLLGQIPVAVTESFRVSKGQKPVAPRSDLPLAANFLYMLRGTPPDALQSRAMDVSLILYAEHEFNASTFTARVVCSTEADLHSSIVAAIGALKGRLHGGANEKVMDMLRQAGGPESAESWLRSALERKDRIMGFGHRVYKHGDVRAGILKKYAKEAAEAAGQSKWEKTAEIIERVLENEKNLL